MTNQSKLSPGEIENQKLVAGRQIASFKIPEEDSFRADD